MAQTGNTGGAASIAAAFLTGGLDRAAARRTEEGWCEAALAGPSARVLPLWQGRPMVGPETPPEMADGGAQLRLGWLAPDHPVLDDATGGRIFLGMMPPQVGDEAPWPAFAADLDRWQPAELDPAMLASGFDASEQPHPTAPPGHRLMDLRRAMMALDPAEAEAAATARGLIGWHGTHRFCARCGGPGQMTAAGWQMLCPACGAHHFPRTDPVVIMLIQRGNRLLLARSPGWPEGMYSLPAGFMEPGETVEAAVRREVTEETAIRVGAVRYVASQPWPFPASLMIGCIGEALNDEIVVDKAELDDARWFSREEVMQAAAGHHPWLRPARRGAIAHGMIASWLQGRI